MNKDGRMKIKKGGIRGRMTDKVMKKREKEKRKRRKEKLGNEYD